jgi:hypothetical protein
VQIAYPIQCRALVDASVQAAAGPGLRARRSAAEVVQPTSVVVLCVQQERVSNSNTMQRKARTE